MKNVDFIKCTNSMMNGMSEQIAEDEIDLTSIHTIGELGSAVYSHRISPMLNKKSFPTLMLVLLSLAAIPFAFAFFWNSWLAARIWRKP